jgi:hypothetical protein
MHRVFSLKRLEYSAPFLLGGDRLVKDVDDATKVGNQSLRLRRFPGGGRLKMTLMFIVHALNDLIWHASALLARPRWGLRKKPARAARSSRWLLASKPVVLSFRLPRQLQRCTFAIVATVFSLIEGPCSRAG